MPKLKEMIIVAFAFVGVVVGAGFATGQEIFQFFTSNGKFSVFGVFITGFIITIGGVFVLNTGYRLRSHNHTEPIKFYLPRTIAAIFDIILTLFLLALAMIMTADGVSTLHESFGISYAISSLILLFIILLTLFLKYVHFIYCFILTLFLLALAMIMTAGGVSTLHESFGITYAISSLILVLIILATLFLKFDRLITVLGMVTPFLVIIVTIIAIYYFITGSFDFNSADQYANNDNRTDKWWWFDAINYGSLQIAAAFSFLSVMGGRLKYEKSTIYGGILGGAIVTF